MDFDGDGRADILSGSWPGEIYLFRGLEDGQFAAAEILKDRDGEPIKAGSASAVFVCDWDGNGTLDLLIGNFNGEVRLLPNDGTRERPQFGPSEKLTAGGKEIEAPGGDAGPLVADWDGDGRPDLLIGNGDGSVHFYRNTGSREAPELAAAEILVASPTEDPSQQSAQQPQRGSRAKLCVTDWNQDGRLDLLVGDVSSEQVKLPELQDGQKAAAERAEARYAEVFRRYRKLVCQILEEHEESDDTPAAARRKTELVKLTGELRTAHRELSKYPRLRRETRGWVWVFLRTGLADVSAERNP